MANTLVKTMDMINGHVYVFKTTSAATSETVALPLGKDFVAGFTGYIGGTPTATSFSYVRATGVGTFATLTATNEVLMMVITD